MAKIDEILLIDPNTGQVAERREIGAKAENVSIAPAGNITDNNLQDVLEDLDERISNAEGGGTTPTPTPTPTPTDASNVSYDNTDSGLGSKNVQEAIDEVADIAMAAASSPSGVPTAFERNRHRGSVLFSQAKYLHYGGGNQYRLPQFLIITDNHGQEDCLANAINMSNGFKSIMGVFQLGDLCQQYYLPSYIETAQSIIGRSRVPVYNIIGNHDVGSSDLVYKCTDNAHLYTSFIKPMVDKGWLTSGEYEVGKAHWYHDISYYDETANTAKRIRIIGINEYDFPDDTINVFSDVYWEPVQYDQTAPVLVSGSSYEVGDIVNENGYTKFSFRCVSNNTASDSTRPKYKFNKRDSYISETQANWLKGLLEGSGNDGINGIVVLMHQEARGVSNTVRKTSMAFCDNNVYNDVRYSSQASNEVVYSLLTAFASRSNGSVAIDSALDFYDDYTVDYDFTDVSTDVILFPIMAGHYHKDSIETIGDLTSILSINSGSHVVRGDIEHGLPTTLNGYITDDCINVVTFDAFGTKRIVKLCKLGATYTVDGYERDQEEFNWETLATPIYGDKQVKSKIDALES